MTTPSRKVLSNRDTTKFSTVAKTPNIEKLASKFTPKSETIKKTIKENSQNETNLITVAVRVRPLSSKEAANGYTNSIRINEQTKEISVTDKSNKPLKFMCDHIISDQRSPNFEIPPQLSKDPDLIASSQQKYVYECIGKPLLDTAFDGYNVSIFAYGQTGSGKTYSMIGPEKQPGLIPRFFDDLFERKAQRDRIVSSTHIEISYYEIYNEKIYDLLRNSNDCKENSKDVKNSLTGRNLQIRENPQTGPYIVDLLTLSANSTSDAKLWLDIGNKRRATACTNMNQKSSRSHSVFQINITQTLEHKADEDENGKSLVQLVTSRINLVDLAGSERLNSSGINSMFSTGTGNSRFKESTCINKSLLTLGKIICLLSERQSAGFINLPAYGNGNNAAINNSNTMNTNGHLPYRESVLTWLLKESLGGNAKTAMLATVNASSCYIDETICTLRYAAKTATIKNSAHLNRNFKQKFINEFGVEQEMNLALSPMNTGFEKSLIKKNDELQETLKLMELEWKQKLEEAERLKQKEINDLEKSLIVLYEKETSAQNCCLINLNEDPLLSEKLIYVLKKTGETLIGSDRNLVNIHLSGALISEKHSKILSEMDGDSEVFYLVQLDEHYVTYLNGEVISNGQKYLLNHGDRIIFGGSHFFRFNNPKMMMKQQQNSSANSSMNNSNFEFKDYQFAKNEIERKQNELIQKKLNEVLTQCQRDGDMKIKELKQQYEKNLESIKSDYERENSARRAELELLKSENKIKLKKIVEKKILIETKLNLVENQVAETNKEIDKQQKELIDESTHSFNSDSSAFRTPSAVANRRFINKLYSEKKISTIKKNSDQQIVQFHASSNCLFSIALRVTEANKICSVLGYEYEFKRYEIQNSQETDVNSDPSNHKTYIQAISVLDKRLKLITLWNMATFEDKLNMLRDQYNRYIDEDSISSNNSGQNESIFLTDSNDEWQTMDSYIEKNECFSPRVIDHATSGDKKSFKRRLSFMNQCSKSNLKMPQLNNNDWDNENDCVDSTNLIKRKCITQTPKCQNPLQTPVISFTPGSVLKSKSQDPEPDMNSSFDVSNQLNMCYAFVYATCRDALNDDDFQLEDEDELLDDSEDEENLEPLKKVRKSQPSVDDTFLKSYARLTYNLTKLYEIHSYEINKKQDINRSGNSLITLEDKDTTNKPLYCCKILMLYSQLSQFKPDYWSLINEENIQKIKKCYRKINKILHSLRESINFLFKSIENNLETLTNSKFDLIMSQINKLFYFHGEYQLLSCTNTLLNRTSYSLMMIDAKFLHEYSKGIDKQFEEFLNRKLNFKENFKNPVVDYIKNIKNFWIETQCSKIVTDNLPSSDLIIDYCNYVLQTHFRLSNVFKTFKRKNQLEEVKLKAKLNDQILDLMYNILTDSLALITTFSLDDSSDEIKVDSNVRSRWSDVFEKSFKELKHYLKNEK
ncbi:unnamed protein product [Brachionus calyciflorus]|uniref:KIF14 n=1 Tax=Brachionus calyciflorus TaxID=104777 RepID=A0A813M279_9BILA|nr:unnamed protein product [Brachionus calyciflorus]